MCFLPFLQGGERIYDLLYYCCLQIRHLSFPVAEPVACPERVEGMRKEKGMTNLRTDVLC
jgi:hypothetical protein